MQIKSEPISQSRIASAPVVEKMIQRKSPHMKKQRKLTPASRSTFALAVWHPSRGLSAGQAIMLERCRELKVLKRKMKEDIKAQVAGLAQYTARMKRAPEEMKFGLMNAFLTHMAEQQIDMNARQAALQEEMTTHMILHMQIDKESLSKCAAIWGNG